MTTGKFETTETVSRRLLDQRLRNRIIEVTSMLAEGEHTIRALGAGDYFNNFYTFVPDQGDIINSTFTYEETAGIRSLRDLLNLACESTPLMVDEEELLASGWPAKIAGPAQALLQVLLARGEFSEDVEQTTPDQQP